MSLAQPRKPIVKLSQAEVDTICRRHERLWAAEHGGARAIFADCDLSGLDLSNRPLMDADFSRANLTGTRMSNALLDKVQMVCAVLDKAVLRNVSLRHGDLRGASLRFSLLAGADLFEADLGVGSFDETPDLGVSVSKQITMASRADFSGADLTRAKLRRIHAEDADFSGATLHQCKLTGAYLRGARFHYADLSGADLLDADLGEAKLTHSVLIDTRLERCNLGASDLTGAVHRLDVADSALAKADLLGRLLTFADWVRSGGRSGTPCSFEGADLRPLGTLAGRDFSALQARGACLYGLNLSGCCLAGADLCNADLRQCNLSGADLRGVRLRDARLDRADLSGANLNPLFVPGHGDLFTDLRGAHLSHVQWAGTDRTRALFGECHHA